MLAGGGDLPGVLPDLLRVLRVPGQQGGEAHDGRDGTEYYYCLTSLEKYDTLLLFLIPAEFVASGTVGMVGAVVRMLLIRA